MKKTKIVCTIGPASESEEVLESLIKAGMNVMRLNFSHGDHEEHLAKVKLLRKLNEKLGTHVAFMLDTKGPEIRTGSFGSDQNTKLDFTKGDKITLTTKELPGTKDLLSVSYKGLPHDVEVGGHILIDDGLVDLLIDEINGDEIKCTFLNSATLKGRRGVNVPGAKLKLKAMTEKDKSDLEFACKNGFDFIAASFIRKADDVIEMREFLNAHGGERIKIISKIENQEGIDNFDEILKVTDGIMVARGDLGVEIPIEQLPVVQKMMIRKTVAAGKPVITATQMLESMQKNPRPTRAEVSDVANAVYDGTSAVMLSGESAQGEYPIEAVTVMAKIVESSEQNINYWKRFKKKNIEILTSFEHEDIKNDHEFKMQANFSVCCTAMFSQADAIIAISENGETPSMLSSFKPKCPIYVVTANEQTARQMSVETNVTAIYIPGEYDFERILKSGVDILKERGLLKEGDSVVLSGGLKQNAGANILAASTTGAILKI
ncbi:MAG: pyruvate kinase [Clostridia bacterium]|nr:pyruvate kinase [Clostridia bacterium]